MASAPVDPATQTLQPTPTISGTPRANTASTGVQGTWDTGTAQTRKWYADGVEIVGATATTYTPTVAQIGQVLTFEVTSTRAGYTTVVKTSPGKPILALAQTLTPTPLITGTAKVANTLTGDPGTWDVDTALSYQWFADGTAIDGATGLTHDVTPADLGKAITFAVTSTKASYETVTRTSGPTAAVSAGDLTLTPVPTITGTPKVGASLTAVPGTWDDGVTLAYQWTVDGTEVGGATTPTYPPVPGDLGKVITVKVTGAKDGYPNVTKESDPTAAVASGDLSSRRPRRSPGRRRWPAAERGPRRLGQRRRARLPVDRRRHRHPGRDGSHVHRGRGRPRQGHRRQGDRQQDRLQQRHQELTVELEHRGRRPGPDPGPDDHGSAAGEPAARRDPGDVGRRRDAGLPVDRRRHRHPQRHHLGIHPDRG